jgi:hypothetical protein
MKKETKEIVEKIRYLHLSDGEIAIQPIYAGQQEQLGRGDVQKGGGQVFKPAAPVRLRAGQVHRPPARAAAASAASASSYSRRICCRLLLLIVFVLFFSYGVWLEGGPGRGLCAAVWLEGGPGRGLCAAAV